MASLGRCVLKTLQFKNSFLKNISFKRISPFAYVHNSRILCDDTKGQEIKMPSLSPTMTEGTIVRWLKKEGETISPGDVLCEIQTDKAIVGFEVEDEGILAKILVPNDTKDIKIGTVIGVMVDSDEDWKNIETPIVLQHSERIEPVSAELHVQGIEIKMPSLSPTMTEGTIVKWLKKEGDIIAPGDILCEIQTDKAVVGFEIEDEGILAKILVREDTKDVQLGTVIAMMVTEGEDWKNVLTHVQSTVPAKTISVNEYKTVPLISSMMLESPRLCGPSVRNLLKEYGIKYSVVTRTGPHNVLLKGDVIKYISNNNLMRKPHKIEELISAVPDITYIEQKEFLDIPHTSMRQTIARRLTESKSSIPHAYMSMDCRANDILKLRSQMKSEGVVVSLNDFIIKCAAQALVRVPEVNVVHYQNETKKMDSIDISIAVATEKGLITPIVKKADTLGVQQISECVKVLAVKAREGRLKPEEYQGGSFSISNLGMFGISEFSAVINPPQGAILAIGSSRLVFEENNNLVTKMTVTLSFDGRMIDESNAGRFLQCFKQHLEKPLTMAINSSIKSVKSNDE